MDTTTIWIVESGKLVEYKRTGECNQCGDCCCKHKVAFQMRVVSDSDRADADGEDKPLDYSKWEGWSVIHAQGCHFWFGGFTIAEEEGCRCSALSPDGKCLIWKDEQEFPPICRYWPLHPDHVAAFPNCSFEFKLSQS